MPNPVLPIIDLPRPIPCTAGAPGLFANDSNVFLNQLKVDQLSQFIRDGLVAEVDGYKDKFAHSDAEATRVFDVAWTFIDEFKNFMLGWSNWVFNQGSQKYIHRVLPDQHPKWPWLFCQEIELLSGLGAWVNDPLTVLYDPKGNALTNPQTLQTDAAPLIEYLDTSGREAGLARYACHYRPLPGYYALEDWDVYHPDSTLATKDQVELNRFVARGRNFAAKNLPLPKGRLQFVEGPPGINGQPIPELGDVRILPITELTYTWFDVPSLPLNVIDATVGHVNDEVFDGCQGYPAYDVGTVLCQTPAQPEQRRGPTGRTTFTMTYRMLHNPNGWNRFIAPDGNFYKAQILFFQPVGANPHIGAGRQDVYPSADFSALFTSSDTPVN